MDADSGRVCPGRKRFPTSGLGSAAAAPLEPTKRGAGRMLSGAGAARWTRSPRPSNAPAGSGDAKEGTLGVVRSLTTAPKGERASVRPAPGALLFLETHPTLEIQRSRKFRKRNCKRVSRSLGAVSQASRRRLCTPDTRDAVKAKRPSQWRSLRRVTIRVPGAPPSVFYAERAPAPSRSTNPSGGSGAVVGRVPAASRFLPPPAPSYKKGKLGPCENPEECSL